MGVNQVFVTEKFNELNGVQPLVFMNNDWTFGLSTTECADSNKITDSGAGGTAIACGKKTSYASIGEYQGNELESIAEYLHRKKNYKVGIITSVPINHATPSCFYGHEEVRDNFDNLIDDLIQSNFEFFAGGGFLLGNDDTLKNIYKNFDEVIRKLEEKKYCLLLNDSLMSTLKNYKNKNVILIDTALRNEQMQFKDTEIDEINALPYALDFPKYKQQLAEYTTFAQDFLMNDTGFFIMVEGGKIDWACHGNDALSTIYEINAFNEAITKAYDFYLQHPENTLIIITADHETGGMAMGSGNDNKLDINSYSLYLQKLKQQSKSNVYTNRIVIQKIQDEAQVGWVTHEHTSAPVGVWAMGKGKEKFAGIMKNSDIKGKILELLD